MMARESDTTNSALGRAPAGWGLVPGKVLGRVLGEVLAILLIFAAAGAWPAPDVNETAYLTKARHFADPSWGRGDFFLETPDAHGVFYLFMGPMAASLPLAQAAWIGRWLGWLALAVGFRHATMPLLTAAWPRILAAAVFSLALRNTTAAGEWVLGGCESKVFAWALVLAAIGELARGRFSSAWLTLGGATALHPIVGGWGLVALVASRCFPAARGASARGSTASAGSAPHRYPLLPAALLIGGVLLAAAGIVPALGLSAGADQAMKAAAAKIHVVERLSHHLLPRTFADGMVARHVLAILLWWILRRLSDGSTATRERAARVRVDRFLLASLVISLSGIAVSLLEPFAANTTYSLLRFYWFRLADVLVPFGLATAAAAVLMNDSALGVLLPARPAVIRAIVGLLLCLDLAHESRHWPLPGRTGLLARSDAKVDAVAWQDCCHWIAANTPADACFLTPRGAASLTWWTGRREVVGWKNSPQDARSLVEWRRRIIDCFSREGSFVNLERSTAALGPERLRRVAEQYDATHAIIPLDVPGVDSLPFERLHANRGYAIYRLP
jgi:hypothetical protein